ncbi:MAG: hypothetical protein RIT28_1162 [Pseudomonadota bacterium]
MRTQLLPLMLLLSCAGPESDIDKTTLTGTARILPGAAVDVETDVKDSPKDSLATALDLGSLSWRPETWTGKMRVVGADAAADGVVEKDWIVFRPAGTGAFSFTVTLGEPAGPPKPAPDTADTADTPDTGDTSEPTDTETTDTGDTSEPTDTATTDTSETEPSYTDVVVYEVAVYDLSLGDPDVDADIEPIASAYSDGTGGTVSLGIDEVKEGGEYAFVITPVYLGNGKTESYTVSVSGSDPNDGLLMVGAYTSADNYLSRGNPVAGAQITDWVQDEATGEWVGSYEMIYVQSVTSEEGENEYGETIDNHTVGINLSKVWLVAGDFTVLNQGLPAGTLYNTAPIEVSLSANEANTAPSEVVLDAIAPKLIGFTFAETEPNEGFVDIASADYALDMTSVAGANALPVASGLGYVDIISGVQSYGVDNPSWNDGDYDVFALTVSEPLGLSAAVAWEGGADLDFHIYDSTGAYLAVGWGEGNTNPERFTLSNWGAVLQPGETYYLVLMGYEGPIGEYAYTIELEWLSP